MKTTRSIQRGHGQRTSWVLSFAAFLALASLAASCKRSGSNSPTHSALSVTLASTSQSVAEGAGAIVVTVQLSEIFDSNVNIPFSTLGSASIPADFSIDASPLVIPAGQLTGDITITIVDDNAVEPDETIEVTLETPANALLGDSVEHITTILDDDAQPTTVGLSVAAQSVSEGAGSATLMVMLSAISASSVSVPFSVQGSATSVSDYTIDASPLLIPAGQIAASITISVVDDVLIEPSETIEVTLGTPVNAILAGTTLHIATIVDNDALQLAGTQGTLFIGIDPASATSTKISDTAANPREVDALAFDSNTNTLYGVDNRTDELVVFDRTTGLGTVVGATGFSEVNGLAFDPNTSTLYGVDNTLASLITIDTSTGVGTLVGSHGFSTIGGLAFDPSTGRLYAVLAGGLILIDTATGVGTSVGQTGFQLLQGLTFDPVTNTLYGTRGTSGTSSELFEINKSTGLATLIAFLGSESAGFAFDPNTGEILGADMNRNHLVAINPATLVETYVGSFGLCPVGDLAFDSNTNTLYGVNRLGNLITINRTTGAGTVIGSIVSTPFMVQGLAFDPLTNSLFGTESLSGQLIRIDTASGSPTFIGPLGFQRIEGLAFDSNTGTLYATDTQVDMLIVIDSASGAGTAVGALGFNALQGLAFDPNTDTLYGSDSFSDKLISIDPATGAGTLVGTQELSDVRGLGFDPNTNTLYGNNGQLLVIDTATGIGNSALRLCDSSITGLAFDPHTNTLYGTDTFTDQLMTIDPLTGDASRFGNLGFVHVASLAFDPNTNTLYGVDSATAILLRIDTTTGVASASGFMPLGFAVVVGLAFDPNTNTLYGADSNTDQLITINTLNGVGVAVGPFGFAGVEGLGFDAFTNTLYGSNSGAIGGTGELISIDTTTGASTTIGKPLYWPFGLTGPAL